MRIRRKIVILSLMVSTLLIMQTVSMAAAYRPPPIDDPPPRDDPPYPTIYGYCGSGTVKDATTGQPISGATVKIYYGAVYEYTSTDSTGFFREVLTSSYPIPMFYAKVTKSGYYDVTKSAATRDSVCDFGIINMQPKTPPETPVIGDVGVLIGGVKEVALTWSVDWDDTADGFYTECWWSSDAIFDSEDWSSSTDIKDESYTVNIPYDEVGFTGGTYWIKIYARNSKNGFSPDTTYGPESVELGSTWNCVPIDDAYTQEYDPYGGTEPYNTDVLYADGNENTGFNARIWLKFWVGNVPAVSKATLFLYYDLYYPEYNDNGFGHFINAYSSSPEWDEASLTHVNSPEVYEYILDETEVDLPPPCTAIYHSWDVTGAIVVDGYISITLGFQDHADTYFYSKEASSHQPYLEIEFWGEHEQEPQPVSSFVDEYFTLEMGEEWQVTETSNPAPYWITRFDAGSGIWDTSGVDEGGALSHCYFVTDPEVEQDGMSGYYYEQSNLAIDGAFAFELRLGQQIQSGIYLEAPSVQAGIELLNSAGNLIAGMSFNYSGWWVGEHEFIHGRVGNNNPEVQVTNHRNMPSLTLNLLREPYTNKISLTWYDAFSMGDRTPWDGYTEHTLVSGQTQSDTVATVRLVLRINAIEPSGFFYVSFDSVKQLPIQDFGNLEDEVEGLLEPLSNADFESDPFTPWVLGDNSFGALSPEYICVDGGHSIYASGSTLWRLIQEIDESREKVNLDALRGHNLGFSIMARYADSPSRIRVGIRYSSGELPFCIMGEWVYLQPPSNPDDEPAFTSVPVTTRYPIPESATELQVIIEGVSSDAFSAYIDHAVLSRLLNVIMPEENNVCFFDGDSVGQSTVCLTALDTYHVGSRFQVNLGASLIVRSFENYKIDRIDVRWRTHGDQAVQTYNTASSAVVMEENEDDQKRQWTKGDGSVVTAWNTLCGIYSHPLVRFGTALVVGGIVSVVGFPISTIISTGFSLSTGALLTPYHREIDQPDANYNTFGHWGFDYPDSDADYGIINTNYSRVDIEIGWSVDDDHSNFPPYLLFDFTVVYRLEGGSIFEKLCVTQPLVVFIQP